MLLAELAEVASRRRRRPPLCCSRGRPARSRTSAERAPSPTPWPRTGSAASSGRRGWVRCSRSTASPAPGRSTGRRTAPGSTSPERRRRPPRGQPPRACRSSPLWSRPSRSAGALRGRCSPCGRSYFGHRLAVGPRHNGDQSGCSHRTDVEHPGRCGNRLITQSPSGPPTSTGSSPSEQLDELGVTRHQRQGLVERGWLHLMAPRVYGISGAPASTERRLMLGLLSLGDDRRGEPRGRSPPPRVRPMHRRCRRVQRPAIGPACARPVPCPLDARAACHRPGHDRTASGARRRRGRSSTWRRARIPQVRLEAAIDSAVRSGASAPLVHRAPSRRAAWPRPVGRTGGSTSCCSTPVGTRSSSGGSCTLMRTAGLPSTARLKSSTGADGRTFARVDFSVRGPRRRGRGVRAQRPRVGRRASAGRSAPQRAPGHRPQGLRVHVPTGDRATRPTSSAPCAPASPWSPICRRAPAIW